MRHVLITPLLVVSVSAALLVTPAVATPSGANGLIYYVDLESNLRAVSADGTPADIEPVADVASVDVSPDGTQLLVRSTSGGLELRSTGGGEPRAIETGVETVRSVTWAPDGQRFAFVGFASGAINVYVSNLDGATPTNLTSGTGSQNQAPAWSPDGSTLYF